jgi:predicted Zn-ribbon and HTH transcriptional regulator
VSKLTDRFKGLAKTLDKTAARLGALPAKCHDPGEYVGECPL